ncbi:MAG: exosortase family protein XrtF [Flavobacterium sp.]
MKNLFLEYRPFLVFLAKFFLSYLILALLYQVYLGQFDAVKFEIDGFTQFVSDQTVTVISWLDCNVTQRPNLREASANIIFHDQFIARIVEGCNALSVIILFIAFLISFSGTFKNTLIFGIVGIVIIHVFNIIRIALLVITIYYYPESTTLLHDIIFPLFIYGIVFMLWILWINKFSFYATKNTTK